MLVLWFYVEKFYNDLANFVKPISSYFLTSTSTELEYRNAYITIPANTYFVITVKCIYNYYKPLLVAISLQDTLYNEVVSSNNGNQTSTVSYSGYINVETTYYIWAKYNNTDEQNRTEIIITGFMM